MLLAIKVLMFVTVAISSSYGVYLLFKNQLSQVNEQLRVEKRVRKRILERKKMNLDMEEDDRQKLSEGRIERILRFLDDMLQTTHPRYEKGTTLQNFLLFHGITAGILTVTVISITTLFFGVMIALSYMFIIIIVHSIRLRDARLERGYKLAQLTEVLATQYNRMAVPDMLQVLRVTSTDRTCQDFRRQLAEIVRTSTNYLDEYELKEVIDRLHFSINTSFAKELCSAIYKSLVTKEFIGNTLTRIHSKIHRNMQDILNETQEQISIRNLSRLHLIAFPGIMIAMVWGVNISEKSILYFQFQTPSGQIGFVISVVSIAIAWFFSRWFTRQPNDY